MQKLWKFPQRICSQFFFAFDQGTIKPNTENFVESRNYFLVKDHFSREIFVLVDIIEKWKNAVLSILHILMYIELGIAAVFRN